MIPRRHQLPPHIPRKRPPVPNRKMLILNPARIPHASRYQRGSIPYVRHNALRLQHHEPLDAADRKRLRIEHRLRLRDHQTPAQRQTRPARRRRRAQTNRQHRHPRLRPLHHFRDPQPAMQILRKRHPDQSRAVAPARNNPEPAQIALQQPADRRNLPARQRRIVADYQPRRSRPRHRRNLLRQFRSRLLPVRRVRRRQQAHERGHHRPKTPPVDHSLGRIISCTLHRLFSRILSAKTHLGRRVMTTEVVNMPALSRARALQAEGPAEPRSRGELVLAREAGPVRYCCWLRPAESAEGGSAWTAALNVPCRHEPAQDHPLPSVAAFVPSRQSWHPSP